VAHIAKKGHLLVIQSASSSHHISLVGGFNHLQKYDFVSWDDDIPN